jgi:FkbM family methyltransferase
MIGRFYGFKKLLSNKCSLLRAVTNTGKCFYIRDTNSQFHSIYFKDFIKCYEPDVSGVIELFLFPGDTFVDIGSNWGHHSFAAALNKKTKVILFEPNPSVYQDALRITRDLGLENQITLHNLALSSYQGHITLSQNYFESGVATISEGFSNKLIFNSKCDVIVKKLFGLKPISYSVQVQHLDFFSLDRADVIKIDAEGVELEILKGGINTIRKLRPVIIFEFFPSDINELDNFKKFFSSISYKIYLLRCMHFRDGEYIFNIFEASEKNIRINTQYNLVSFPEEKNIEVYLEGVK